MPWVLAMLRGQKVYARAKADGDFEVEGGRVEIRYKPTDAKAYRASVANLARAEGELLPDDTCVPGSEVPARSKGDDRAASAKGSSGSSGAKAVPKPSTAEWIAYTDGACSGNPGPAGSGMVIVAPGGKIHEGFEYLGASSTNNVAELTGILRAVEAIPKKASSIAVHTDSKYAIGVLSKGWKAKANQELIARARIVLGGRANLALVYVPGHAGVPLNERADELAREAIRRGKSQPLPQDL
jgi:ribonuclease HI